MNKLNPEELGVGAVLGLGFFWVIGLWAIPLAIVTSLLWAIGGAGWLGTKAWRRFGVPLAILIANNSLSLSLRCAVLAGITYYFCQMGYGSRDVNDPVGSPLGNWWLDRLGDRDRAKWASRASILMAVWVVWIIGRAI